MSRFSLTVLLLVTCVSPSSAQEAVRESYAPTQEAVQAFYPPTGVFATQEALAAVVSDLEDFRLETDTDLTIIRKKLDAVLNRLPPETPAPKAAEPAPPKAPAPKTHTVDGHSHKCPKCGHVWAHAGGHVSHNCPVCGTYQNVIHQEHVPIQAQVQSIIKPPMAAAASGCSGGNCSVSQFFGRRRR